MTRAAAVLQSRVARDADQKARAADAEAESAYRFRPSLMSAEHSFRLAPEGLEFHIGRHSGRIRYATIRRLRISFRPIALASNRYLTEVWSDGWPKVQIASTTWRSLTEQVPQTAAYTQFIRELHHRIAQAGGQPVCERGSAPWIYWPGVILFAAVALGLAALIVRGLHSGAFAGALFVGAFLALYLWQMGGFFKKNRPGVYDVRRLPDDVFPRS
jgi:hypothetical protein